MSRIRERNRVPRGTDIDGPASIQTYTRHHPTQCANGSVAFCAHVLDNPLAFGAEGGTVMNQGGLGEPTSCCDCSAEIWPEVDRAFSCAPESYLCFACTERRGGVYDAQQDRWLAPPNVSGLFDERRPHA